MPPPTSSLKPTSAKSVTDVGSGAKATGDKKSSGQMAKPDQFKYNAEQDEINKEIAAVKEKIVSVPHGQYLCPVLCGSSWNHYRFCSHFPALS